MNDVDINFEDATQGAVIAPVAGKTRITIRLDADVISWFKAQVHAAGGGNYQTLINTALRDYIRNEEANFEDLLRKVIREELDAVGR